LEPVAQARDVALRCDVFADLLITGDAEWLERLLLNLLDNAIKFSPARFPAAGLRPRSGRIH
jgi:signal transduction histidine kinase